MLARLVSWSAYPEKAARIRSESGLWGLLVHAVRKLASPMIGWGGITFFERRLDVALTSLGEPVGVSVRAIAGSEVEGLKDGIDPTQPPDEIAGRFRRGDRGYAAIDASGKAAHVRWVTRSHARIPEIGRDIVLAPHQAYFYNGYTRPEARGRGIDGAVRGFIFRELQAEQCHTVYSYVRRDNPAGLRAAARWQRPVGTLWYVRIGRFRPVLIPGSRALLPTLVRARVERDDVDEKQEAWRRWFESWLGGPLARRSTGCCALPEEYFQSAATFIDQTLKLDPQTDTVLDVGCDSAMISHRIAPKCRRFLGVDFIPGLLTDCGQPSAIADGAPAWFAAADGRSLPIRSKSFAKVYCSAVIHTLPSHEDGLAVIDELIRVTRPGGTVLVSSIPDRAKRNVSLFAIWRRAGWKEKLTLPIRWLLPQTARQLARRLLRRSSSELPAFLHYDLTELQTRFQTRGLACQVRDFPPDYWSADFKRSRSNLLISIPEK